MPYPTRLLSDGEAVLREFRPHWQSIFVPMLGLLGIVAVAATVGVIVESVVWWVVGGLVIGLALIAPRLARWWFTKYVITNERIIVRSGVISRQGKEIPLEVINDVAFSQTLMERIFRSGDLLLESAGELGQSRFTNVPDPEEVQTAVYRAREERIGALNGNPGSALSDLATLAQLHQDGVLTDEEFAIKKQQLLDDI